MARRLLLVRQETQSILYRYLGAYRLRVDVSDPSNSGADPNVFLYNQRPPNPYDTDDDLWSDFQGVASPADMAEYPVGGPRIGTAFPMFRLAYAELDFRSVEQAKFAWVLFIERTGRLLAALDAMDELLVVEEAWVGAPLPASDSASFSTSIPQWHPDPCRRGRFDRQDVTVF